MSVDYLGMMAEEYVNTFDEAFKALLEKKRERLGVNPSAEDLYQVMIASLVSSLALANEKNNFLILEQLKEAGVIK